MAQTATTTLQLSISGPDPSQRLQNTLREGEVIRIGRAPQHGWAIPWDLAISREHADLCWADGKLRIAMLPGARNPIIYRSRMTKELFITAGDWFQIGATTFQAVGVGRPGGDLFEDTVGVDLSNEPAQAMEEYAYSEEDLRKVAFRNTDQQLEILAKLPRMISDSHSDETLGSMVSRLLLDAIPQAEAVAVAHFDETELPADESEIDSFPKPLTLRVETRDGYKGRFNPSRRMILKSLRNEASVIHIWDAEGDGSGAFTISEGLGWAFCAPIRGESCRGWCMYVSGKGAAGGGLIVSESDLASDLRFTELVAQFIGSIRHVRLLQEQKTQLSSFFSPKVIEGLTDANVDALSPSEKEISVLFCDVRGFSRKSEKLQDDLLTLLHSVSAALGVMAGGILERDGAIADFQGDAALGFWGWPVELEEGPIPACRAALSIYNEFYKEIAVEGSLLEGFSVGLGVAHGRALAGQIGTDKQAKVGVFGPVVNQGARLESMTKQFDVPICIDEATAEFARIHLPPTEGRVRRLARVRPKGMDTPINVFALLPPVDQMPTLTAGIMADYEAALDAVIEGKWDAAMEMLGKVPDSDGPKQFLLRHMAESDNVPPAGWDGAFTLMSK